MYIFLTNVNQTRETNEISKFVDRGAIKIVTKILFLRNKNFWRKIEFLHNEISIIFRISANSLI